MKEGKNSKSSQEQSGRSNLTRFSRDFVVGEDRPLHSHHKAQLLYAEQGVMLVTTPERREIVAPMNALWIPPELSHTISFVTDARMRSLYFAKGECEGAPQKLRTLTVTTLLKELFHAVFEGCYGASLEEDIRRLIPKLITEAPPVTANLPLPSNPALRHAMDKLLSERNWLQSADAIARSVNLTPRTFARHFQKETGMTFRAWRARARLIAAIDMLAAGRSIKETAIMLRFFDAATFSAQFKSLFGIAPSAFFTQGDSAVKGVTNTDTGSALSPTLAF